MSGQGWGIADDQARQAAERRAALHGQRMRLAALRDDVASALRGLRDRDPSGSWRSASERRYASRRAELEHDLAVALTHLDEAQDAVRRALGRLPG